MRTDIPAVYLLAGPVGPAKAAYAQALIDHGVVEVPALSPAETLVECLQTGRDTFLDQEGVPAEEKDRYKALVEAHGGQWCLINFTVDHALLATGLGLNA
jgi:hypothetical protein